MKETQEKLLLHTTDLAVGYRKEPLIEQIAFDLRQGEILTLIGANGAGKSTILKSIVRQLRPLHGVIYLKETLSLAEIPERELAKTVAMVLTERVEPERMTAEDVVAMGRYPYTGKMGTLTREDRQIVHESMELIGVETLKDKQFQELSDGQRQRIMLARAICQEPEILVLDEPTSYLDIRYKLEFLALLQKLAREKKIGVLMSLHELDLAQRVSHRLLCVKGNRIERYGTPEEIFSGGFLAALYGIQEGSFAESTGTVELKKTEGKARVFVIGGNGSGCFTFRNLQQRGIPFSVGILTENDIDYPVAKALAANVISQKAYEEVTEEIYLAAKEELLSCEQVICCLESFGTQNRYNGRLLEDARKAGKNIVEKKQWQK